MKLYNYLFLLLFPHFVACQSQNAFFEICDKHDKIMALPNEHIMQLVELSSFSPQEEIFDLHKSHLKNPTRVALIHSLGFWEMANSSAITSLLKDLAYSKGLYQAPAVQAIYRIGGMPLQDFLDQLFLKEDFYFQHKYLENTWVINNLSDLLILKDKVSLIKETCPEWGISKYIDKTYLPRLEVAIKVLTFPDSEASQLALKNIIESKNGYFRSVSGGIGMIWAIKTLVDITPDDKREELVFYLSSRKPLVLKKRFSPVVEVLFYYVNKLGGVLTKDEIEWLQITRGGYTSYAIIVLRSGEELLDYYNFRKRLKINSTVSDNRVRYVVEVLPYFDSDKCTELEEEKKRKCAEEAMFELVYAALEYPEAAKVNKVKGKAVIKFIVEKDGSLSNFEIANDLEKGCGRAALKAVRQLENFIPAQLKNKSVRTFFFLPVTFK